MNSKRIGVGTRCELLRPFQGRTVPGVVYDIFFGGIEPHFLIDFGPDEHMELCVVEPRYNELCVSASGMRVRILEDK